jgi:single-strand DNA-binding protein
MSLEIEGKLYLDLQTQQVSDKFKKREFVLLTDTHTEYPQHVKFELTQDKCDLLDKFKEGQTITVSFNLRGREWNGKYFTNIQAWRIQAAATTTAPPPQAQSGAPSFPTAPRPEVTPDPKDDLPF